MDADAVVVGGGIAGASVAYHLARAGVDARLIDRGDEGRATDAGAGILAPATSSRTASDEWFRFAADAVAYYRDLDADLAAAVDGTTGFAERPLLSVAVDDADAPAFDRALARVRDRVERLGTPVPGSVTELGSAAARDLFPPLADVARAARYDGAAQVDGRRFADALRTAGERAGLAVERGSVERVRVDGGRVRGVVVDGAARDADAVVVAGGAWSGAFAADLGVSIPVEPMRGQLVHLDADAATGEWPILSTTGRCYAVPWPGGRVVVGATYEAGSGFVPHPNAAGVRTVLERTERVAPGLADAAFREARAGLRPATPDGLPVVGAVPGVEGAFLATGFGPTGLQMGPYSGRVVADLVCGREPPTDPAAFGVERFD